MPKVCITEEQYRKARVSQQMQDTYKLIEDTRESAHLTQKECADILGISQSGYSKAVDRMSLSMWQMMMVMDLLDIKWQTK